MCLRTISTLISQAILEAELRRLLCINSYFLSLHFNIPIFSTVSCLSALPHIPQARALWFYSPQRINCLSSAMMGERQQSQLCGVGQIMGACFCYKILSYYFYAVFLSTIPRCPSLQEKSSIFITCHPFSTYRILLLSHIPITPNIFTSIKLKEVFMASFNVVISVYSHFCVVQKWSEICMFLLTVLN